MTNYEKLYRENLNLILDEVQDQADIVFIKKLLENLPISYLPDPENIFLDDKSLIFKWKNGGDYIECSIDGLDICYFAEISSQKTFGKDVIKNSEFPQDFLDLLYSFYA